jgi:hypothetical protein
MKFSNIIYNLSKLEKYKISSKELNNALSLALEKVLEIKELIKKQS